MILDGAAAKGIAPTWSEFMGMELSLAIGILSRLPLADEQTQVMIKLFGGGKK